MLLTYQLVYVHLCRICDNRLKKNMFHVTRYINYRYRFQMPTCHRCTVYEDTNFMALNKLKYYRSHVRSLHSSHNALISLCTANETQLRLGFFFSNHFKTTRQFISYLMYYSKALKIAIFLVCQIYEPT